MDSLEHFEAFAHYLLTLKFVRPWEYKATGYDTERSKQVLGDFENAKQIRSINAGDFERWTLEVEKIRLRQFLGADKFEFYLKERKTRNS